MTAVERVYQKIKRSRRYVFERKDFDGFASYDQIGRALRQLVKQGELIKLEENTVSVAQTHTLNTQSITTILALSSIASFALGMITVFLIMK